LIIAFFIGLYHNQRKKLNEDSSKTKQLGQPIQYWGNIDSVKGRKAYPKLREFIFIALVAKTDINLIDLDKGLITVRSAVDALMRTMEEYINWGLHYMEDKLIDNPNHYYKQTAFLEEFLSFDLEDEQLEEQPASLDEPNSSEILEEEAPQAKHRRTRIGQKIEPRSKKSENSELPDEL
jgi:hypothetical protein